MHLVLFGGAFDPLHNGHVDIVDHIKNTYPHDLLALVPTGQPVHKERAFFSNDARLMMLQSVFSDYLNVVINDYELKMKKPSYTIDTISNLKEQYNADDVSLVVGFDQLYQFHRWRDYETILKSCKLVVVLRKGINHDRLLGHFPEELMPYKDSIIIHEVYPSEISSSRLRLMIKKGEDIRSYVPDAVVSIINKFQ